MTGLELHPRVRNLVARPSRISQVCTLVTRSGRTSSVRFSLLTSPPSSIVYSSYVIVSSVNLSTRMEDTVPSIDRTIAAHLNLFILRNFGRLAFAGVSAQEAGLGLFENEDAIFGVGARRQIREYGGEPKDGNAAAESSCHLDAPACKRRQHSG